MGAILLSVLVMFAGFGFAFVGIFAHSMATNPSQHATPGIVWVGGLMFAGGLLALIWNVLAAIF